MKIFSVGQETGADIVLHCAPDERLRVVAVVLSLGGVVRGEQIGITGTYQEQAFTCAFATVPASGNVDFFCALGNQQSETVIDSQDLVTGAMIYLPLVNLFAPLWDVWVDQDFRVAAVVGSGTASRFTVHYEKITIAGKGGGDYRGGG